MAESEVGSGGRNCAERRTDQTISEAEAEEIAPELHSPLFTLHSPAMPQLTYLRHQWHETEKNSFFLLHIYDKTVTIR